MEECSSESVGDGQEEFVCFSPVRLVSIWIMLDAVKLCSMSMSQTNPATEKSSLAGGARTVIARAFVEPPASKDTSPAMWTVDRLRSVAIVIPLSFLLGALTSLGQAYLPDWLSSFTNSAGGWSIMTFGLIWLSRSRYLSGIILGVVSFYLLNVGYAVVSDLRGYFWSLSLSNFFVLMSFVAGPPIGLAAAWMRKRSAWIVAIASSALPAILIGEGIYGLTDVAETTSPVYWILSMIIAAAFVAMVSLFRLRALAPILLTVGLTAVGTATFLLLYRTIT
jgi:hypothetical protein